ncbi:ArnT family glycosyltransferase [Limnoglobus roseus]|uniref:GT83 family glycosyltransferase n=1 Tax=Limnoglobus roseus TaxID=2598579 RepID=A0A5C1AJ43_9BACT|nr:glycosyltransferase family 39 protein [Limnoglobus roseus]QEL19469.1 GT83 family glycosyltransferase [Limnoglobus roseus]
MDVVDAPCSEGTGSWFGGRVAVGVLVVAAVALFLVRLGDRAVVSEEVRWAEIAREMRQSGDFLHPTVNGRAYPDKPVGSYWLIVLASHLTGGVDETAARLPSALAGVIGVWVVTVLGRRLYGGRASVFAGAVLATSFGFVFYARRATADVETVTGVLIAVWLYDRAMGKAGPWVIGLWLWMAAVSLTKGLLGFALPIAVFGIHGLWTAWADHCEPATIRSLLAAGVASNRWFLNRWTLLALPLGVIAYLVPFGLALGQGGDEGALGMVWRENVRRFFAPHNHLGPVYLYLGAVFVLASPWSAFLPAAVVPLQRGAGNRGDRLARAYFWAVFLFFTASASRRSYYLLPILPAAALLIGRVLAAGPNELRGPARRLRAAGWAVIGTATALSGAAILPPSWVLPAPYDQLPPLPGRGFLAVGWVVAVVVMVVVARKGSAARVGPAMCGVWLALFYVFAVAYPAADELRPRQDFLAVVRDRTAADPTRLALFHASDTVFDLGRTAPEFLTSDELTAAVTAGRVRWVVAPRRHLVGVELRAAVIAEEAVHPWETQERIANKLSLVELTP